MQYLLGWPSFRGYVSFREGNLISYSHGCKLSPPSNQNCNHWLLRLRQTSLLSRTQMGPPVFTGVKGPSALEGCFALQVPGPHHIHPHFLHHKTIGTTEPLTQTWSRCNLLDIGMRNPAVSSSSCPSLLKKKHLLKVVHTIWVDVSPIKNWGFPGDPIWCVMTSMVFQRLNLQRYPHITHTIHVW